MSTVTSSRHLLEVRHLVHKYPVRRGFWKRVKGYVHAVDDVSFFVDAGETLGLVGETGSGKTTVGRCVVRLLEPTSGEIIFDGEDLLALKGKALREKRRNFQFVFQDPFGSLNPKMTVETIVGEPLLIHRMGKREERRRRVIELLEQVGLDGSAMARYPHEFSGGQRQRVGIARALALKPRFIVCDEPVSALDVSVQAQIVNILRELQEELGLAYLFIAHGLGIVAHLSARTAVMYMGRIVEIAPTERLFSKPLHPYTQALIASIPEPDPTAPTTPLPPVGDPPSNILPPPGCRFADRCPLEEAKCREGQPELRELGNGHFVACRLVR